jgi:hypothetical protein
VIKVYAVTLAVGTVVLITSILVGSIPERSSDQAERGRLGGAGPKLAIGGLLGFAMGGMSAEFSPLDLAWQVSLVIAVLAAVISVLWVRYSIRQNST